MSRCQTCIHSVPIFVSSDIYTDGYGQVCRDCKTKRKDGYESRDKRPKMSNEEIINVLETDCCSECSWQAPSAVECGCKDCKFKEAILECITMLKKG